MTLVRPYLFPVMLLAALFIQLILNPINAKTYFLSQIWWYFYFLLCSYLASFTLCLTFLFFEVTAVHPVKTWGEKQAYTIKGNHTHSIHTHLHNTHRYIQLKVTSYFPFKEIGNLWCFKSHPTVTLKKIAILFEHTCELLSHIHLCRNISRANKMKALFCQVYLVLNNCPKHLATVPLSTAPNPHTKFSPRSCTPTLWSPTSPNLRLKCCTFLQMMVHTGPCRAAK